MKRFRFGLEKVLKLRRYREEEAKNELGKAVGILTEIENKIIRNTNDRKKAVQERFTGIHAENIIAGFNSIQVWDIYIHRLEREAEILAGQAAQAEQLVEEKRNLYLEASRELKVLEKLKEKRQKEHRKEMFTAEAAEMDDMRRAK